MKSDFKAPVVIYDGECDLCNKSICFLHPQKFTLLSGQSQVGKRVLLEYNYNPEKLASVVLIAEEKTYEKSDAIIQILALMGGYGVWVTLLKFTPKRVRDKGYDIVASNRFLISKFLRS